MILKTEQLKNVCSKLLLSIDNNNISKINELLEIKNVNDKLELSITNKEYIVKIYLNAQNIENFHATINAEVFLKLISQITTDNVEFKIENNNLVIIGNGKYVFPMIYDDDTLFELPDIDIVHETNQFELSTIVLEQILNHNSKEIVVSEISHPVQKMYYIDNEGCITFTSGACVTNFVLGQDIKFLLNAKIVKLFKLFNGEKIECIYGYNLLNDGKKQHRIKFKNDVITLITILNDDDSLINAVPVTAIRKRMNDTYDYSVLFNKNVFLQTINRLILFDENNQTLQPYWLFEFNSDFVTIYDKHKINNEKVKYNNSISLDEYETAIDLNSLKSVLDSCKEEYVTFNFGNHQAIVIKKNNVYNIIPEIII